METTVSQKRHCFGLLQLRHTLTDFFLIFGKNVAKKVSSQTVQSNMPHLTSASALLEKKQKAENDVLSIKR